MKRKKINLLPQIKMKKKIKFTIKDAFTFVFIFCFVWYYYNRTTREILRDFGIL